MLEVVGGIEEKGVAANWVIEPEVIVSYGAHAEGLNYNKGTLASPFS